MARPDRDPTVFWQRVWQIGARDDLEMTVRLIASWGWTLAQEPLGGSLRNLPGPTAMTRAPARDSTMVLPAVKTSSQRRRIRDDLLL